MIVDEAELDRRNSHRRGAERDQRERAHADRLVGEVAVDADRASGGGRGTEPHQRVLPFDVHAENLRALKACGAVRFRGSSAQCRAFGWPAARLSGRFAHARTVTEKTGETRMRALV